LSNRLTKRGAKAIAAKSLDETMAMYDAEAFTEGSAMPPARGLAAIRTMWAEFLDQPNFSLAWNLERVVVTESATIATTTGNWRAISPNGSGAYLAVWRKQPDGKWKILIDSAWYSGKSR